MSTTSQTAKIQMGSLPICLRCSAVDGKQSQSISVNPV